MSTVRCWQCGQEIAAADAERIDVSIGHDASFQFFRDWWNKPVVGYAQVNTTQRVDMCQVCAKVSMPRDGESPTSFPVILVTAVFVIVAVVLCVIACVFLALH
jgi:ABC-type sugar transport system permease subunit